MWRRGGGHWNPLAWGVFNPRCSRVLTQTQFTPQIYTHSHVLARAGTRKCQLRDLKGEMRQNSQRRHIRYRSYFLGEIWLYYALHVRVQVCLNVLYPSLGSCGAAGRDGKTPPAACAPDRTLHGAAERRQKNTSALFKGLFILKWDILQ